MDPVHVIGAGMAGLACAVRLAGRGRAVILHEAAGQAGGRCRSYFDPGLDRVIDNGNHLLLSANAGALEYLDEIAAADTLTGPGRAEFPFMDLRDGRRWTVRPNGGRVPWWVFSRSRRIPGTRPWAYLSALSLLVAGPGQTVADRIRCDGPLYEGFWRPLTVAALNADPTEASARLMRTVIRESFARGGAYCRPLVVRDSLAASLVDPALARLRTLGAEVRLNDRLRAIEREDGRVRALVFADGRATIADGQPTILAVPPWVAGSLLPELTVPVEHRAIVNGHVRLPEPPRPDRRAPVLGLIGGTADWLFLRGDVASLTVSAADALADRPAAEIAGLFWADTARALGLDPAASPAIRVIKERRATFAQTPAALARRPGAVTRWRHLLLAGDWTDTGLPATIDGAVRSGFAAADRAGDR